MDENFVVALDKGSHICDGRVSNWIISYTVNLSVVTSYRVIAFDYALTAVDFIR